MDINAICSTLDLDLLAHGLQILDAHHLARLHFPPLDPNIPALIARCESQELAAQCRRSLLLLYPGEHHVTRVSVKEWTAHLHRTQVQVSNAAAGGVGTPRSFGEKEIKRLRDFSNGDIFGPETFLYIPPLAHPASFNALANVTAHLRAPEGCPWDREQTHESLRQYLLEECYEVLETLDHGDAAHLQEELGDLMSLILLQIQIAHEADEFSVSDVLAEITAKLVRRHPHVFGDTKVNGMDELLANWEKIKSKEKGKSEKAKVEIPRDLPALMRAQKVAGKQKKRGRGGDAETRRGGEIARLKDRETSTERSRMVERLGQREIMARVERLAKARDKEKALGEALFALAAYAEANGIDAESALRAVVSNQ